MPKQPIHAPSEYTPPVFGAKQQYATVDKSPAMTPNEITRLQKACGKFLWYAHVCDPTMEHMLNSLLSEQAKGTKKTLEEMNYFLDY